MRRGSRTIEIYCDAASHAGDIGEIGIGTLISEIMGGERDSSERWDADGPNITVQGTLPPALADKQPGVARLAAEVAGRYRFRCPACGLDVVAGDRFGGRHTQIGYSAFVEADPRVELVDVDEVRRRVAVGFATWTRLTLLADRGVLRLSLTGLQAIFSM